MPDSVPESAATRACAGLLSKAAQQVKAVRITLNMTAAPDGVAG
jgi:hypothetical protein